MSTHVKLVACRNEEWWITMSHTKSGLRKELNPNVTLTGEHDVYILLFCCSGSKTPWTVSNTPFKICSLASNRYDTMNDPLCEGWKAEDERLYVESPRYDLWLWKVPECGGTAGHQRRTTAELCQIHKEWYTKSPIFTQTCLVTNALSKLW